MPAIQRLRFKPPKISTRTKNIARSLGYIAIDVAKDLNPSLNRMYSDTKTMISDVKTSIGDITRDRVSQAAKDLVDPNGQNVVNNLINDFKTGNWYNKDREENAFFGDDEGFDFDEDFEFDSNGDDQESSSSDAGSSYDSSLEGMKNLSSSIAVSMGKTSAASAEYIATSARNDSRAVYSLAKTGFNTVSTILLNIDSKMDTMISLQKPVLEQAQNTYLFQTNATEFFNRTTETLNTMNATLELIAENTKVLNTKPGGRNSKSRGLDSLIFGDEFSFSSYFDMIKENIAEQTSMYKSMYDMSVMAYGKNFKGLSPIAAMLKLAVENVIPESFKEASKSLNTVIEGAIPALIQQLKEDSKKNGGSILGDILSDIFLPDIKLRDKINTSNYNKGPVPWDGIARKSVVEVIPTYLAKIYAQLGGDEKYYDYENGRFIKLSDVTDAAKYLKSNAAKYAGGKFRDDALRAAGGNKQLEAEIENYFLKAIDNGFSSSKVKTALSRKDDAMLKKLGLTKDSAALIDKVIDAYLQGQNAKELMKFNTALITAQGNINQHYKNEEEKGYSIYNYTENGFDSNGVDKWKMSQADYMHGMYQMVGNIYALLGGGSYNTNLFNISNGKITDVSKAVTGEKSNMDTKAQREAENQEIDKDFLESLTKSPEQRAAEARKRSIQSNVDALTGKFKFSEIVKYMIHTKFADVKDLFRTDIDEKTKEKRSKYMANHSDKIKEFLQKENENLPVYLKPFEAMTNAINSLTDGIVDLFWGERKEGQSLFGKAKEMLKNAWENSETKKVFDSIFGSMKDALFGFVGDAKTGFTAGKLLKEKDYLHTKSEAFNAARRREYMRKLVAAGYSEKEARRALIKNKKVMQDNNGELPAETLEELIARGGAKVVADTDKAKTTEVPIDESGAARGRKVTRTGFVAVSEGELIIPSEYNPFYHGATNKRRQILNENKIVGKYLGSYAEGDLSVGAKAGNVAFEAVSAITSGVQKIISGMGTSKEDLEKQKQKLGENISGALEEAGVNRGYMGVGAITGAGVSLLTGAILGPIAGAALGAGLGLVTKSEKVQEVLFGKKEKETDEEYENSLRKGFKDFFAGNGAENTIKGTVTGTVGGLLLGSPLLGAIAGAGIGFVSSSEKAQEFLFGKKDEQGKYEGTLGKMLDKIKENLPNVVAGASVGALLGPFGVVGGTLLGGAFGLYTTTDKFKMFMFGEDSEGNVTEENKKKSFAYNFKTKVFDNINGIFHNASNRLAGFFTRLTADTADKMKDLFAKAGKGILGTISKFVGPRVAGVAEKVFKAPFKAITGLGNPLDFINRRMEKGNIAKGYSSYDKNLGRNLTAAERLAIRQKEKINDKGGFSDFESALAGISSKGELDNLTKALANNEESYTTADGKAIDLSGYSRGTKKQLISLVKDEKAGRDWQQEVQEKISDNTTKLVEAVTEIKDKVVGPKSNSAEPEDETEPFETTFGTMRRNKKTGEVVTDDSTTDATQERRNKFFESINSIPVLGTALNGLRGLMGSIKDGLFGNKDENKKGIFSTLFDFLSGKAEGIGKAILEFISGNKITGALKNVVKGVDLGGAVAAVGIPALFAGAIFGAFDKPLQNIFNKIGNNNDTKSPLADNTSLVDDKGNPVTMDENGNYVNANTGAKVDSSKVTQVGNDTSASTQIKKNLLNGLIRGKVSLLNGVAKVSMWGFKRMASKGNKLAGKFVNFVENQGAQYAKYGLKKGIAIDSMKLGSTIGSFLIEKLPPVINRLPFPDSIKKNIILFCNELGKKLGEKIFRSGKKVGNLLNNIADALPILSAAYTIARAEDAWGNAESILGITEDATFSQKILATLIGTINSLIPGIGDLIPDKVLVNIFMEILPKFGVDVTDLQTQRESANEEVSKYNAEKGTEYSIEEYNQAVKRRGGFYTKMGNTTGKFIKDVTKNGLNLQNTKDFFVGIGENVNDLSGVVDLLKNIALKGDLKEFLMYQPNDIGKNDSMVERVIKNIPVTTMKANFLPAALISFAGHRIFDVATGVVNKIKGGFEAMGQEFEDARNMLLDPKDDTLQEALTAKYNDPENPINGFQRAALTAARVAGIGFTVVGVAGKKIKENVIDPIVDKVKGGFNTAKEDLTNVINLIKEGSPLELINYQSSISDDNPIAGFLATEMLTIPKMVGIPFAGLSWAGHKIGEMWDKFKSPIGEDAKAFREGLNQMSTAGDNGDIEGVMSTQFTHSSMFGGVMDAGFGLFKMVNFVKAFANKYGGAIKDFFGGIIDGIGEKVGGVVDTAKGAVSKGISTVSNAASGVAKGVSNVANAAYDVVENFVSGGSSGIISQYDPRISGTMGIQGCAPSVAAMTAKSLGRNISVSSAVNKTSPYRNGAGVDAAYFGDVFGHAGINTNYLAGPYKNQKILNSLNSGKKVILLGQRGGYSGNMTKAESPFGPRNHYVLATGYDRNGLIIKDPELNRAVHYPWSILSNVKMGIAAGDSGATAEDKAGMANMSYGGANSTAVKGGSAPKPSGLAGVDESIAQNVYAFFTGKGYSPAATAGILGNMYRESHVNPSAVQGGGSGPAAGIVQWESIHDANSRFGRMKAYAASKGKDWTDLDSQLEFVDQELNSADIGKRFLGEYGTKSLNAAGASPISFAEWKNSNDPIMATNQFEGAFERAGKPGMDSRREAAAAFYNAYSGSSITYDPSKGGATGSGDPTAISSSGAELGGAKGTVNGNSVPGSSSGGGESSSPYGKGIFNIIGNLSTLISNAFMGGLMGGSKGSSSSGGAVGSAGAHGSATGGAVGGTTGSSSGGSVDNALAGVSFPKGSPSEILKAIVGKISYSMRGPRNPEKGSADCSSTVQWAIKKAGGPDIGGNTGTQYNNSNLSVVQYSGGNEISNISDNAMKDDVMFFARKGGSSDKGAALDHVGHVGIYMGGNQYIDHGSGMGPKVKDFKPDSHLIKISRVNTGFAADDDTPGLAKSQYGMGKTPGTGNSGGDSGLLDGVMPSLVPGDTFSTLPAGNGTNDLTRVVSEITKSGGGLNPEAVNKLLMSVAGVLGTIASNTSPIEKIYQTLVEYANRSGGDSGLQNTTKPNSGSAGATIITPNFNNTDVSSQLVSLANSLAELAKG